jgi:hypothetical protein
LQPEANASKHTAQIKRINLIGDEALSNANFDRSQTPEAPLIDSFLLSTVFTARSANVKEIHPLVAYAARRFVPPCQFHSGRAQKTDGAAVVNAPLKLNLTSDTTIVSACRLRRAAVRLTATAVRTAIPIKYRWTTTAGTIIGEGSVVTWNLAGLKPGYHKASLDIISTRQRRRVPGVFHPSQCWSTAARRASRLSGVEISCPTRSAIDKPLTFTSRSNGGTPGISPVYNWTSPRARSPRPRHRHDHSRHDRARGQTIRASLSVGGYNLECAADCAVSIPVPKLTSRRFRRVPGHLAKRRKSAARQLRHRTAKRSDRDGLRHRLPGEVGKRGEVQQHAAASSIIWSTRAVSISTRIVTLVGPARDQLDVELWITPQGATPPNP